MDHVKENDKSKKKEKVYVPKREKLRIYFAESRSLEKFEILSELLRDLYKGVKEEINLRKTEKEYPDEKFENDQNEKKYYAYLEGWRSQMSEMILKKFDVPDDGKLKHVLDGHSDGIFSLVSAQLQDRVVLISGGYDCQIRVWETISFENNSFLDGHTDAVTSLCLLNRGEEILLASASFDNTVRVWDLEKEECIKTFDEHTDALKSVIKINDGKKDFLVSAGVDKKIKVWDLDKDNSIHSFTAHKGEINALAALDFGNKTMFASASSDLTIKTWELGNSSCVMNLSVSSIPWSLTATPHYEKLYLISGSSDWNVRVYDVETEDCKINLAGLGKAVSSVVTIKTKGKTLIAAGGQDGNIKIWDLDTKKVVKTIVTDHLMGVFQIYAMQLEENMLLVSCGGDFKIKVWEL